MSTNFIADAPEPSRSTGTITLSWGLLNIELSLFTGTEETNVSRKEFVDGDVERPAGRAVIDKSTGEVIDNSRVVRMAQASNGTFVVLTDDEQAACTGVKNVAEVVTFISNADIFNYMPHKLHQVRPKKDKGVPNPAGAKAFSLLISAMASQGVSALVKVALRGPAQYGILTATGDLLFVFPSDGVRKPLAMGLTSVTPQEQDMARNLISAIGIAQAPHIPDATSQEIAKYVNAKAGGNTPAMQATPPATNGTDLMDELMKSIEARKNAPKWGAPTGQAVNV
jgi:non-homologous end joining protein Ku